MAQRADSIWKGIIVLGLVMLVALCASPESEHSKKKKQARNAQERAVLADEIAKPSCESDLVIQKSFFGDHWIVTCPNCGGAHINVSKFLNAGMVYEIKRHAINNRITLKELMYLAGEC